MASLRELLQHSNIPDSLIRFDVPMSGYTTFRVGGPADCLIDIASPEILQSALALIRRHDIPFTVIGNGSNLLVRDGGIRGIVLRISSLYNSITQSGLTLTADAGISLSSLAQFAASHRLAGLSPLSGIPGTLGGAVIMNAGAYGAEIGQFVSDVRIISTDTGKIDTLDATSLCFGYRTSSLMDMPCIVLSVTLILTDGSPDEIRSEMQALAVRRREKQPLEYPSAGSTFKRPQGAFAAKLIDDCGLRGYRIGDAQVSEKHCGFVVNRGNATADDILALMQYIKETVLSKTGYTLEPEVRILGTDDALQGGCQS